MDTSSQLCNCRLSHNDNESAIRLLYSIERTISLWSSVVEKKRKRDFSDSEEKIGSTMHLIYSTGKTYRVIVVDMVKIWNRSDSTK